MEGSKTPLSPALIPIVLAIAAALSLTFLPAMVVSTPVSIAVSLLLVGLAVYLLTPSFSLSAVQRNFRWWHACWVALFVSGLVFRVRDTEAVREQALDFWALFRALQVALVGLFLLSGLASRRLPWFGSLFKGLFGWLTAYALLNLASTLWSLHPSWTLYKSLEYLVDLCLAAAIASSVSSAEELKKLFDWNWALMALLLASTWLGVAATPESSVSENVGLLNYQIAGSTPIVNANAVGDLGAILAIVSLTRLLVIPSGQIYHSILLSLGCISLIFSQSRSPLTGFVVASILVSMLSRRLRLHTSAVLLVCLAVLLGGFGDVLIEFILRGQPSAGLRSLSGRVDLWRAGWNLFTDSPLIGQGAFTVTRFAVAEVGPWGNVAYTSAHNVIIEVITGVGILGLVPLIVCIVATWRRLWRSLSDATGLTRALLLESIGVLTIMTIRAIFSSGSFIWHPALSFLAVLSLAEWVRRRSRRATYPL